MRVHEESLSTRGVCHACREPWPCGVDRLARERDAAQVAWADLTDRLRQAFKENTRWTAVLYWWAQGKQVHPDWHDEAVDLWHALNDGPTRGAAILAAAQKALDTLEYVWEAESHSTRIRDTIDGLRAALGAPPAAGEGQA